MAQVFRFGAFELDIERGVLMRHDNGRHESLHVPPQPFRALHYLVERPGRLVARDDLARAIWSHDVFVEQDLGLGHCIRRLRQVLGDEARRPRFIETVPRRGFRFVAEVEIDSDEPEATTAAAVATRIAVLPFASHSPHLVEIRFGEGLAEEVLREAFRVAAPASEILALHRSHDPHWQTTTEAARPDWVLTGSARYDTGLLRVLAYTVRAADGAVVRTGEWQDEAARVDLDLQRRAAEALVRNLLPTSATGRDGP